MMNGLLKVNLSYSIKQHETPIKTAYDKMSCISLEESPSRNSPEIM